MLLVWAALRTTTAPKQCCRVADQLPACQRLSSAADSLVSSSCSLLVPSRFILESSARSSWPSVGSVRVGAVCLAAPVTTLLCLLAWCPLLSPTWAMLVDPVVSTLGCSRAASRASS